MTAPGRLEFLRYGALLDWPPVETGEARLDAGEVAWLAFTATSTPPQRQAVLVAVAPWLTPALVATEAARARVRRWAEAGGLAAPDTPEARRAVTDRITVLGDDTLYALVRGALARLPLVVLDHVRRHAVCLPVGRASAGFALAEPGTERDAVEGRQLLVLGYRGDDEVFAAVVGHEAAHAWLEPLVPRQRRPPGAAGADRRRYVRLAAAWGRLEHVLKPAERAEYDADRLARSWGFTTGPDGAACAQNARRMVLDEAAAWTPVDE